MSSVCVEWRGIDLRLLVADWPSIPDLSGSINQMTIFEVIITILHCLSDCVLAYYVRLCKYCCELGLCLASSVNMTSVQYRIQYNTIQCKTCNVPHVTKMLFVGADLWAPQ